MILTNDTKYDYLQSATGVNYLVSNRVDKFKQNWSVIDFKPLFQ